MYQFEGSFRGVLAVLSDTERKEMAKSFRKIVRAIRVPAGHISLNMGRFCSQLGLDFKERVAAEQLASAVCPPGEK